MVMHLAPLDKTVRFGGPYAASSDNWETEPMTIRFASWRWVMLALSTVIALFAVRYFVLPPPEAAGPEFGRHLAGHGYALYAHAGGGAIALLTGALQWMT